MAGIKRYRRCEAWDYSHGASLFITIATEARQMVFGRIEKGEMRLSELGKQVEKALKEMPRLNVGLKLFGYVVMPDHIHFNVALGAGRKEPLKVLGFAIRRFKVYTTKLAKHSLAISTKGATNSVDGRAELGQKLWQQGYHDRLCPTREMIDATERYIRYNPLKWQLMYRAEKVLAIHEPLDSPRLDLRDYWKGVGNVGLLDVNEKILGVRISRKCKQDEIEKAVQRIWRAVDLGYIVLSGFVSPGEKQLRDKLCLRADARFIRMLPSGIPNARFKPESQYVEAFASGRYLEIGRGNDGVDFSRAVCLNYNEEIIRIANAGEGLSLYWRGDGKVTKEGEKL